MSDAESSAVNYFAAELKAQRAQRGWTQVEVGDRIGYSGSYVSDLERGDRLSTLPIAQACDGAFKTPGTFIRCHEIAKRTAYPSFFAPVVPLEQEAVRIHGWELGAVPGLLQTEAYARSLIRATRPHDGADAVERLVAARLDRQEILRKNDAPRLWYVLDEGVLRRIVGNNDTMSSQLARLVECARASGTVLQVVPYNAGDHAGTDGPITLFEFSDHASVIYAECNRGGRIVEDPLEVADMSTTLNMIRASALSPRDTLDLLPRSGVNSMDSPYWRKSSYSGGQGGNCVEVGAWRTSSHTGNGGGNCVEVGDQSHAVLVRDTKDRDCGTLTFSAAAWRSFTGSLR